MLPPSEWEYINYTQLFYQLSVRAHGLLVSVSIAADHQSTNRSEMFMNCEHFITHHSTKRKQHASRKRAAHSFNSFLQTVWRFLFSPDVAAAIGSAWRMPDACSPLQWHQTPASTYRLLAICVYAIVRRHSPAVIYAHPMRSIYSLPAPSSHSLSISSICRFPCQQ